TTGRPARGLAALLRRGAPLPRVAAPPRTEAPWRGAPARPLLPPPRAAPPFGARRLVPAAAALDVLAATCTLGGLATAGSAGRCAAVERMRTGRLRSSSAMVDPSSAGDFTVRTLAFLKASYLSAAVPLPPATIAPAWPIRFPGGAVTPAM